MKCTIQSVATFGQSTLVQEYSLIEGQDVVEVLGTLHWREHRKNLKLDFLLDMDEPVFTCEVPYGTAERPMDGGENPVQNWMDCSGLSRRDGRDGMALLNDGKYGCDAGPVT